jgi:hypothetical protein
MTLPASLDPMEWNLQPGDRIRRTELHKRYGGSGRSGISPSTVSPNILIFSDPASGHQHGYFDGWKPDGAVHYTGEGKRGDQRMTHGNAAILHHREKQRRLRVFHGAGGDITYLGEFGVAENKPWYYDEAPETNDGPVRQVIVFRLFPLGKVVHLGDDTAPPVLKGQLATTVPLENSTTEKYFFAPSREPTEAERREHKLVAEYASYLRGKGITAARRRYEPPGEAKPLFCDLIHERAKALIEAKGAGNRDSIRQAIGQLFDYGRFEPPGTLKAILLPARPRSDLEALATAAGVSLVWKDGSGYLDNAGGRLV